MFRFREHIGLTKFYIADNYERLEAICEPRTVCQSPITSQSKIGGRAMHIKAGILISLM